MKTLYNKLLLFLLLLPFGVLAQGTVTGRVLEASSGQPLPGVNVVVLGTTIGTSTDFDGKFTLTNVNRGARLSFSYIGFADTVIDYTGQPTISVTMVEDANQLQEVVVQVGYGTVKRQEATVALSNLTAEDFNKGAVISADQLLQGRVAGLQITNGGGEPGGGSKVRIRAGASLNASNDPLYVIDGVLADDGGGSIIGGRNPLANINQNDIASISVLKDAAATAIYGSRASNGVIIITTKRGAAGAMKVEYNGNFQVSEVNDLVDVLSGDEYYAYVNAHGSAAQIALLGPVDADGHTLNTDWQRKIYRTATGTDHNIALSAGVDNLSYRVSAGYTELNGLLRGDNYKRTTLSANLTGEFFDKHLKIDLNNKSALSENVYANRDAIGAAVSFDPTQPVYQDNAFGGYFQWATPAGYEVNAGRNPISLLEQKHNFGTSDRSLGNVQFEYKVHSFEDLKLVANFGYDYTAGRTWGYTDEDYVVPAESGSDAREEQANKNLLMDLFMNYTKSIESIRTVVDVTGGYSYQDFKYHNQKYDYQATTDELLARVASDQRVNLQSFFGRANVAIAEKYYLNASFRADASSRFNNHPWAYFPGVSAAWRVDNESFMKSSKVVSEFKLRASWGRTGQQNVPSRYPSVPLYLGSTATAGYQIGYDADGNPIYSTTYVPLPYNQDLKWEETETVNFGLDFGFFKNRLMGSVDVYRKNTDDLLVLAQNPQGVNFGNFAYYNIGSLQNKGAEFSLDVYPIKNDNMTLRLGGNLTLQNSEITKLTTGDSAGFQGYNVGGISGGTGTTIQNHQVGFSPDSFYVFEQAYNVAGQPIDGVYVDRNNDGIINDNDKYRFHKPVADMFYGLNADFSYKSWWISTSLHGSVGNYNYNNVQSNMGNQATALPSNGNYLNNVNANVLVTNFTAPRYLSDYYIQDASFLRMDNITLGYTFKDVFEKNSTMRLTGSVQNVFVITDYDGIDPENNSGIDNNLYPRPTTYTLGLNINF